MVKGVFGKRRLLVRFQYGVEKDQTSNQLTVITVERIPVTKEVYFPTIYVIPDETSGLDK